MTESGGLRRPPGPKTFLREGALFSPSVTSVRNCADQLRDSGAAVRRALAEEIRALPTPPARTKRRR